MSSGLPAGTMPPAMETPWPAAVEPVVEARVESAWKVDYPEDLTHPERSTPAMDALYARLGGPPAVARLVFDFYDRVLRNERLAPFFDGVDMARLVDHQAKFIGAAMGGPPGQSPEVLREAHAGLGVTAEDFAAMVAVLEETLAAHGLSPADRAQVMAVVHAHRSVIVSRHETAE